MAVLMARECGWQTKKKILGIYQDKEKLVAWKLSSKVLGFFFYAYLQARKSCVLLHLFAFVELFYGMVISNNMGKLVLTNVTLFLNLWWIIERITKHKTIIKLLLSRLSLWH